MSQSLRRTDDVFAAPVDDTTLLLNVTSGRYHGLNPVATRIWELLADPTDLERIVSSLVTEFEVAPEACRAEVVDFLTHLRERGLLVET